MKRNAFQFKQFSVEDQNSALKVNTDAVLLGAWADIQSDGNLLDLGCGCGIIALMAAQKAKISILALDNHEGSIMDAQLNFKLSPWSQRLHAKLMSIQQFTMQCKQPFHQIISNPPFFINSLKSPFKEVNQSKHTDTLTQEDLISSVNMLLHPDGKFFIIFPVEEAKLFEQKLRINNLYIHKKTEIIPVEGKAKNRVLMEISKKKGRDTFSNKLVLRERDGSYTKAYQTLCADFYLNF